MVLSVVAKGLLAGLAGSLLASAAPAVVAPQRRWDWPLDPVPRVVRPFEPPDSPYGPGHRGVDLAGTAGQPVLAIGAGVVTFAGSVAGRGVLVVDHGALDSTYQPVAALVPVGARVAAGQQIGFLEVVHSHCLPDACLHLGVRRAGHYLDPLSLLGPRPVRLKPLAEQQGGGLLRGPPAPPPPPLWLGYALGWAWW
jgi:murein DD-endopeptidase MepM/ murein hydrolase activator NlpD